MAGYYPPVGFHFSVAFELATQQAADTRFQEVSGLNVTVETESYAEGGENRFVHNLPMRTKYGDLELKRGLLLDSGITKWVRDAVEKYEFRPTNVLISLLNEAHTPLMSWYVINAYPIDWSVGAFNAEESKLVIETLKLKYQRFELKR